MANHIATHCPRMHPTPTARHRTAAGHCRICKRDDERARRRQTNERLELARAVLSLFTADEIEARARRAITA